MEEPNDVVADRLVRELLLPQRNVSKSEININAGGIGVTVAVMVALVTSTINVMQARQIDRQDNAIVEMKRKQEDTVKELNERYSRMQDYLAAIYMQAPHLKPPENKK